jgi:hypothetical protein
MASSPEETEIIVTTAEEPVTEQVATIPAGLGSLEEYQFRIFGSSSQDTDTETNLRLAQENRWIEDFIATCMAELGFNYIPDVDNPPRVVPNEAPPRLSLEFAKQYGLGIWSSQSGGLNITRDLNQANDAQLNAMSSAEREAWDRALLGNFWDWNEGDERIPGCWDLANSAVNGLDNEEFASLNEEINLFLARAPSDETRQLDREWFNCMALQGESDFESPADMWFTVFNEMLSSQQARNELVRNWDWNQNPLGPPEESGLEREIELAVLSYNCRTEIDYNSRAREIDLKEQADFVALHQNELEAWAQFMEAERANL